MHTPHHPYGTSGEKGVMPDELGNLDLDALLADSMQSVADKNQLAKNKKKLTASWLSDTEKKSLRAETEALVSRVEWSTLAVVAMFHTQRCVCCLREHTHFMGLFQHQSQHNGGQSGTVNAERWIRAVDLSTLKKYPQTQKHTDEPIDMCIDCAHDLGFTPLNPKE